LKSSGGEDTAVELEANLLTANGHSVKVLIFDNADLGKGKIEKLQSGLNVIYNRSSAKKLREAAMQFQPDIIHVHNFYFTASPSVFIEAHRMNIPIVYTIHNYRLICANALLLRDNKICELCVQHRFPWYGVRYKCYHGSAAESAVVGSIAAFHKLSGTWRKKVDRFITPSEFIRSKIVGSSLKLNEQQVVVKHNFIPDPGEGSKVERQSHYLFVGRLSEEKGIDILLDCFEQLPGIQILIAGDGPEKEKLLARYGALPNIRFLGLMPKSEIINLMKSCRALVFPSIWYEGLPMTIVEAFATGTPVIGSRLGAMEEMIQHGSNGLLFTPGKSDDLKKTIIEFEAKVREGFNGFYEEARSSYIQKYHPDRCYQAVLDIYINAVKNKRSQAVNE